MPLPPRPSREHWGEWFNYIGQVIAQKIRDSTLKYVATVPDERVYYGFHEEVYGFPNIYVIPLADVGLTPTTSGDILISEFQFRIMVEGSSPELTKTDDELRLILGDIIAELMKDRNITFNSLPTADDTVLQAMDVEYLPSGEETDIRRWHMVEVNVRKKLNLTSVVV